MNQCSKLALVDVRLLSITATGRRLTIPSTKDIIYEHRSHGSIHQSQRGTHLGIQTALSARDNGTVNNFSDACLSYSPRPQSNHVSNNVCK